MIYYESGGTPDVPAHGTVRQFTSNSWGSSGTRIVAIGYGDFLDLQTFYSKTGDLWAVFAAASQEMVQGNEQGFFGLWAMRLLSHISPAPAGLPPQVLITRTAALAAPANAPRQPSVTPSPSGNLLVTYRQNNMVFSSMLVGNF